jgi:hypothetical protein
LSNDIYKLNEIAKLEKSLEGRQTKSRDWLRPYPDLVQFGDPTVDLKLVTTTALNTATRVQSNSVVYNRTYYHGGNQYSFAATNYYRQGSPSGAELYVLPFQVNQTTGAITVGTGAQVIFNSASGAETSTSMWGGAGSHAWFFGYLGQTYIAAWTVSNNTVSGIQSQVAGAANNVGAPLAHASYNNNHEQSVTRNGNTSYFAPGARTHNSSGTQIGAYDLVYSYNGTTLTKVRENALDATNTSLSQWHCTTPIAPQWSANFEAGTAVATVGFRQFVTSAGATRFQALDNVLAPVSTLNGNTLLGGNPQVHYPDINGLQLSDGTTLIFTRDAHVFRIGTPGSGYAVTNVTEQIRKGPTAGLVIPGSGRNLAIKMNPVAQDTWWLPNVVTPVEMIKVYINPATLEVKYLDSFNINWGTKTLNRINAAYNNSGLLMTGTDRQFFLTVTPSELNMSTRAKIRVIRHGRQGR